MQKINAVVTGVGGYVPDYILTNDEISKMVDTTDEWIMAYIKRRRTWNFIYGSQSCKTIDATYPISPG